jgi:hypothetical protein
VIEINPTSDWLESNSGLRNMTAPGATIEPFCVVCHQVLLTFLVIKSAILVSLFFVRRHKFPIQQRRPFLVLLEASCQFASALLTLGQGAFPNDVVFTDCMFYETVDSLSDHVMMAVTTWRLVNLALKDLSSKILIDKMSKKLDLDSNLARGNCWTKAGLKGLQFLTRYMTLEVINFLLIAPIIIMGVATVASSSVIPIGLSVYDQTCLDLYTVPNLLEVSTLVYVIPTCVIAVAGFLLIDDNFALRSEIRAMISLLLAMMGYNIFLSVVPTVQRTWTLVLSSFYMGFILVGLAFPLVLSFINEKGEKEITGRVTKIKEELTLSSTMQMRYLNHESYSDLEMCLANPEMRTRFWKFLEAEFAVENLAFYESCKLLEDMIKRSQDTEKIISHAQFMRDEFIRASAACPINIPFPMRSEMLESLQKPEEHFDEFVKLFSPAKKEVLSLMVRDAFVRFQMSEEKRRSLTRSNHGVKLLSTIEENRG